MNDCQNESVNAIPAFLFDLKSLRKHKNKAVLQKSTTFNLNLRKTTLSILSFYVLVSIIIILKSYLYHFGIQIALTIPEGVVIPSKTASYLSLKMFLSITSAFFAGSFG